ncbi:MAG: putative methyltransferase [Verrucomicrobia bacterium ADurb.Bin345]|nr:MAG: putative methyltransferase [Verrucomicrobia bacterium ADurb.Bin345]
MKRFERTRIWLSENGVLWTLMYQARLTLGRLAERLDRQLRRREEQYGLPGTNPVKLNLRKWETYDWSKAGEEWTESEAWKQALVTDVMAKHIQPSGTILEIGPGAGRWTEFLQKRAGRLLLADLSPKCIELCRERFSECSNIEYHVTDGSRLEFIRDGSVDSIWSFDVFVHIGPPETEKYIAEFARILKPGGRGLVHHPREGGGPDGFRSSMTARLFAEMTERHGMKVVGQITRWGGNNEFNLERFRDVVTVFEKP